MPLNQCIKKSNSFTRYGRLRNIWLFAFFYTVILSLLFQKVLLPSLPSLHAGLGLLKNDAFLYHNSAQFLAENIRQHGWAAWSPWSAQTNSTGNVAILAALYAIFSPSPVLIIPINAFFHATSAIVLSAIGRVLWPGRVGYHAGLISAILFVIFPSSLSWYSQPLKDSYVILGVLLIFYSWLKVLRDIPTTRDLIKSLVCTMAGIALIAFVKPYYLKLLLVAAILITFVVTTILLWKKHTQCLRILMFYSTSSACIIGAIVAVNPYLFVTASGENYSEIGGNVAPMTNVMPEVGAGTNVMPEVGAGTNVVPEVGAGEIWRWEKSLWIPRYLEKNMELAAKTRVGMIRFNQQVGAGSLIDEDSMPQSANEVFQYFPRALQIGLFSPFPNTWAERPSVTRLIAVAETALWYLIAPGLLLALYFKRSLSLAITIIFAGFFMTIFSFVTPNVGTLYRYRYAFEFLLIVAALGGWIHFYINHKKQHRKPDCADVSISEGADHSMSKQKVFSSALTISMLTLFGYLGFFARDLLIVRRFGVGDAVDVFFLGSMIPMFFVSVFSIPAGAALLPAYSALRCTNDLTASRLVSATALSLTIVMAILSLILYVATPLILSALNWNYSAEKIAAIGAIMNVYLFIMILGGVVVVANTLLNAEEYFIFPATAQLIVPTVVLFALLLFGTSLGIYAAVYGMLIGQIINLVLVMYALWSKSLLSLLRLELIVGFKRFPFRQYVVLVAAALSTALLVPTANTIAANLPSGSVTIIGLGLKIILLIAGVIGMGMTTVLLPYFSSLVAKSHHLKAQSDLSLFLLLATLISIPTTLILRMLTGPLTTFLMAGSSLSHDDINQLIRTTQYGVAQLPFFTVGLITTKYITAYQRTGILLLSSIIGLAITIILSKVLTKYVGVSGISLAITLSMVISTTIQLFYANYVGHLPVSNSILLCVNWLVFVTMYLSLHFHLIVGLLVCGVICILLSFNNWKKIITNSTVSVY
jgi:putative peptidoglycan lipid II flippase